MHTAETRDLVVGETLDLVDIAETRDLVDTGETMDQVDTAETHDLLDTGDTVDHSAKTREPVDLAETWVHVEPDELFALSE